MKNLLSAFSLATGLFLTSTFNSIAGQPVVDLKTSQEVVEVSTSPFDKGRHEFQALAGAFFSANFDSSRDDIDLATAHLRMGWMLTTPHGSGFFRGNCEFLVEAFGGPVIHGPGNGLVGASLLLRYNFVQPDARLVPYVQIGGGGIYSDAYKDHSQSLIGAPFEFNLQARLGLHWFCTDRCAFTLEGGYLHISNASLASRNIGANCLGGLVGVSFFF